MLARMRMFVRGIDAQAARHDMRSELIVVDWNPPEDRPPLCDVLPEPVAGSPLCIRYISVPNRVHQRWEHCERIPLFQMIAKNVGIRRAAGRFVLATNVDLLFSDALCEFLARGPLDDDRMYRANRCDVPDEMPYDAGIDDQLAYCRDHVIRRIGSRPWGPQWLGKCKKALLGAWGSAKAVRLLVDSDGCGDFTLLARRAWEEIRGYPELGLYSIYVDGLGCHTAVACGYEQTVLSPELCTYHLDHGAGWMSMSVSERMKFTSDRPSLDWGLYCEAARWVQKNRRPLDINDEEWGCRADEFEEQTRRG